jgi:ketosteroid isomerase-like protein
MSLENVEIVARMLEAWVKRDFETVEAAFDPEVVGMMGAVDGDTVTGTDALSREVERWRGTWTDFELETEGLIDVGDHVLHITHHRGRGKGSGVEVEAWFGTLFTLLNGKIVLCRVYGSKEAALAAAGLSEQ